MTDKDFTKFVNKCLKNADKDVMEKNKNARIALKFEREFKSFLIKRINDTQGAKTVTIKRYEFIDEICNYDIRKCMDNDTINDIAIMGYQYHQEQSSDETLILIKNQ